jgi:polyribonucleotide 5'-hydroxyl-kinase
VDRLAGLLARRAEADPVTASAGVVINTFGWVDGLGYELQKHVIQAFKVSECPAIARDTLLRVLV